jgi:hypothetical protein
MSNEKQKGRADAAAGKSNPPPTGWEVFHSDEEIVEREKAAQEYRQGEKETQREIKKKASGHP